MPAPRDVVITGVGVVCPIGIGRQPFWSALESGTSGICELPEFAGTDLPFRFGGAIQNFDPKEYVQPRKTLKVMSREIQTAFSAAMLAMQDAALVKGAIEPDRLGVVLGSEMLYGELGELADSFRHSVVDGEFRDKTWPEHAMRDLFPLWMLKYLPNMASCHIGIACDARGPNNSLVQGGVSSLLAVMEASRVLTRGQADVMIAGGSGAAMSASALSFRGWEHLSKWHGPASQTPRPFDARRDGTVVGEGSACLVLETREHAQKRGATILARIAGFASRFRRPQHIGDALKDAIEGSLAHAGITVSDVGHINAHAGGRIDLDAIEGQVIRGTLGDVPVTAPKSYFGDLGAGSGAAELIASVLALVERKVPPTLNYEFADPSCPVNVVKGQPFACDVPVALALNLSATGQAAAVVLDRE